MSYYDHATSMAFRVDRWSDEQARVKFELSYQKERRKAEEHLRAKEKRSPSLLRRCLAKVRLLRRVSQADIVHRGTRGR